MAPVNAVAIRRTILAPVDNAVEHAPVGGSVAVEVAVAGRAVTVSVSDTGGGVDPSDAERVFRASTPARRQRRGRASAWASRWSATPPYDAAAPCASPAPGSGRARGPCWSCRAERYAARRRRRRTVIPTTAVPTARNATGNTKSGSRVPTELSPT